MILQNWVLAVLVAAPLDLLQTALTLPRPTPAANRGSVSCGSAPKVVDADVGLKSERDASRVGENPKPGLPAEVVRSVVRGGFASFRSCYEASLRPCPNLQGRVTVNFTIQPKTGRVSSAKADSDLGSGELHRCIEGKFKELQFPSFEGPPLRISYPITFAPGGS